MKSVRTVAVSINQTPLDWDGNVSRIQRVLDDCEKFDNGIIVFPELCISGYGCEDAFLRQETLDRSWKALMDITYHPTAMKRHMIICVGLPVMVNNQLFNCVAVIQHGNIVGIVPKQRLANEGIHYERRWFTPWEENKIIEIKDHIKFGDLVFESGGIKFGFEICEDGWNYKRPGINLAERGVHLILNPSASHFSMNKHNLRRQFILEGSRAFSCAYVYSNLLGCESGRVIYDGGCIIANQNKVIAEEERFSFRDHGIISAVVELEANEFLRAQVSSKRFQDYPVIKTNNFCTNEAPVITAQEISCGSELEEISCAVSLGLKDYLRKTGSKGYVVSLSGGADSSCVALLVHNMLQIITTEFSAEEFITMFPQFKKDMFRYTSEDLTRLILTCMYQATENSSETTEGMAKLLCDNTGADFRSIDVDPIFKAYQEIIDKEFGFELSWENHDIALQNLQARVRSPSIWMIANIKNALLLTTSNRSEAAVGYVSMDGDTSGGLAPIAGLSKEKVLEWLKLQAKNYHHWLSPITEQEPTAELKPRKQTDEDDLMPYPILNFIEEQAFLYKRSPKDILKLLGSNFDHDLETLKLWAKKFFRLWSINQWKRERYAPAFHLDDRSLDPKTWCRFPILNGQFKKELEEL